MKKITKLQVCGKTSDRCGVMFYAEDGSVIYDYCDEVPSFFPGDHYGDYIEVDIDPRTGMILNWGKVSQKVMQAFINKAKSEGKGE